MGKIGNCQVAVSVHAVTEAASAPLDWRLFIPESWDDEAATTYKDAAAVRLRQRRCRISDTEHHRPKWRLAVEMIDDLIASGHRPRSSRRTLTTATPPPSGSVWKDA